MIDRNDPIQCIVKNVDIIGSRIPKLVEETTELLQLDFIDVIETVPVDINALIW